MTSFGVTIWLGLLEGLIANLLDNGIYPWPVDRALGGRGARGTVAPSAPAPEHWWSWSSCCVRRTAHELRPGRTEALPA